MERGTVTATVGDILSLIDDMAPFDTQAEWDNAGLLAGAPGKPVTKVLAALDVSVPVIEEAIKLGAELILTHHPILFHARKNLREDDPEGALLCALIRSGRSLIAAHTNFDQAEGGVNDVLARALGLQNIVPLDEGLRVGDFRVKT